MQKNNKQYQTIMYVSVYIKDNSLLYKQIYITYYYNKPKLLILSY